ncbi:hypothetical protein ACLIA0_13670 [Bacillaceae bacterium W0354]
MRKLILVILLGFIFLYGCNSDSLPLSYIEMSKDELDKNVQSFFEKVEEDNGVHLYYDEENTIYVYLNGRNVLQGEEATYFTEFDIQADGETLKLLYKSDETLDYKDGSFRRELYYKVTLDKKYEIIRVFNNGEETRFGTISG